MRAANSQMTSERPVRVNATRRRSASIGSDRAPAARIKDGVALAGLAARSLPSVAGWSRDSEASWRDPAVRMRRTTSRHSRPFPSVNASWMWLASGLDDEIFARSWGSRSQQ